MAWGDIWKRQNGYGDDPYDNDYDDGNTTTSWWWSPAGLAVRYAIVIILFVLIAGYFVGGYWHARRRLRKGLQPLSYHRWMVRRQMYYSAQYPYAPNRPYYNPTNDAFASAAHRHTAPPPAYNAGQPPPPRYEPAVRDDGKIAADQTYYGAPPVHRAGESSGGASNLDTSLPATELSRH